MKRFWPYEFHYKIVFFNESTFLAWNLIEGDLDYFSPTAPANQIDHHLYCRALKIPADYQH